MAKYLIDVATERCSGCLQCDLACSDAYTNSFNPSIARIQVTMNERDRRIRFTDKCVSCGICVDQCLFGALSKTRQEEENQ